VKETTRALDPLADQATQLQAEILQHRMVLDYLLAEEEGVCDKLNDSNCCLQLTIMVKLLNKSLRQYESWLMSPSKPGSFSWLPGAPWAKRVLFYMLCDVALLLFLPCLIPCFMQLIQCTVSNMQFIATSPPDDLKCVHTIDRPKPESSVVRTI